MALSHTDRVLRNCSHSLDLLKIYSSRAEQAHTIAEHIVTHIVLCLTVGDVLLVIDAARHPFHQPILAHGAKLDVLCIVDPERVVGVALMLPVFPLPPT